MKKSLLLISFVTTVFIALASFTLAPKAPKTVVFFGDSITYAGAEPNGYIDLIRQKLKKKGKADKYNLIGAGIGGNKVPNLQERLERDVLSKNPDLVFIYIGINDVWHASYNPPSGTPIEQYEAGLKDIIGKIKASGAKVVLCTPSVIGEKKGGANAQDAELDRYAEVSRQVAKKTNVKLCDLRKAFTTYIEQHNPDNQEKGILTSDKVHLNQTGNELVAAQMMKFLK